VQEKFTPLDIEKGTNLTHLKRVRKSGEKTEEGFDIIEIILCAVSTVSREDLDRIVNEAYERGIKITPRIVKVSKWPAYNPRQLAEFKSLWPVALRKDTTR
jgi:proline dehydrogenase